MSSPTGGLHRPHGTHRTRGGSKSFGDTTLRLQSCIQPAETPSGNTSRFPVAAAQTDGEDAPRMGLETIYGGDLSAGYTKDSAANESVGCANPSERVRAPVSSCYLALVSSPNKPLINVYVRALESLV